MTHEEYDKWLARRQEIASKAVEPSSLLGLAGEMRVLTYQQPDINSVAAKQQHLLEKERSELSCDGTTVDFTERQSEFAQMLNNVDTDE